METASLADHYIVCGIIVYLVKSPCMLTALQMQSMIHLQKKLKAEHACC